MLGVRGPIGVIAPVPQGVLIPSPPPLSDSVGAYMPNSVEDVRFSMDLVRLGGASPPFDFESKLERSWLSFVSEGGVGGSVEAGVI